MIFHGDKPPTLPSITDFSSIMGRSWWFRTYFWTIDQFVGQNRPALNAVVGPDSYIMVDAPSIDKLL